MRMHSTVMPMPKLENDSYDWFARHDAKRREAAAGNHPLIFIGDSITHLFEDTASEIKRGGAVWHHELARYRPFNLGYGWDRTQNVLCRLGDGEFEGQTPRLVVLLIGTNNLTGTQNAPTATPEEIRDGVEAICRLILRKSPATRILNMGLFPRSTPQDPLRDRIRETNALLERFTASMWNVAFMDIGARFLQPDGTISTAIMNDLVHPTEAGYRIWFDAIRPILDTVFDDA